MLTKHIQTRSQQRGIRQADLDLVSRYGTHTSRGVILTKRDIARFEREFKRRLNRLEKLNGVFVAEDGGTSITVWRATKHQRRSMLESR